MLQNSDLLDASLGVAHGYAERHDLGDAEAPLSHFSSQLAHAHGWIGIDDFKALGARATSQPVR
jgi:hypothetical protein